MGGHVHTWEHDPRASNSTTSRYRCACGAWARRQWSRKGLSPLTEYRDSGVPYPEWFQDWADRRAEDGDYRAQRFAGPAADEDRQPRS